MIDRRAAAGAARAGERLTTRSPIAAAPVDDAAGNGGSRRMAVGEIAGAGAAVAARPGAAEARSAHRIEAAAGRIGIDHAAAPATAAAFFACGAPAFERVALAVAAATPRGHAGDHRRPRDNPGHTNTHPKLVHITPWLALPKARSDTIVSLCHPNAPQAGGPSKLSAPMASTSTNGTLGALRSTLFDWVNRGRDPEWTETLRTQMRLMPSALRWTVPWLWRARGEADQSLIKVVMDNAAEEPAALALEMDDTKLSWGDFDEQTSRVAHVLSALGVQRGDVVALLGANSPM